MTGIVDYGVHVPRYHVTAEAYEAAVGRFQGRIDRKAVAPFDEDTLTMGIDAARSLAVGDPDVVTVATTRSPQPGTITSGVLITALGLSGTRRTLEFGSSWRAGLEALDVGLDSSPGLVVASDDPRGPHDDSVEHVFGAGAAAIATGESEVLARLLSTAHYVDAYLPAKFESGGTTDLQLGQYTTDGFQDAVSTVVTDALDAADLEPEDLSHVVLPQDDVKMAWRTGTGLGFSTDQLSTGFVVKRIGFAGAAMPLLGLASVLDQADPEERLLVLGYGYGHGASAMLFETTGTVGDRNAGFEEQLERSRPISYDRYRNLTGGEA